MGQTSSQLTENKERKNVVRKEEIETREMYWEACNTPQSSQDATTQRTTKLIKVETFVALFFYLQASQKHNHIQESNNLDIT
jgi:hypothetical protein